LVTREAALIRKHERAVNVLVGEQKEKVEDVGVTIVKLQKENARLLRRVVDLEGMKEAAASDNDKLVKEKRELEGKEKQMRELKNVARAGKRNLRNALDTMKERATAKVKNLQAELKATREIQRKEAATAQEAAEALLKVGSVKRLKKKGRPCPVTFERHVRALMATGMSAEACRLSVILNAKFFLGDEKFKLVDIPNVRWFRSQREGVGIESTLLQWVRVAGCDGAIQFGFDETNIDCQPTFI
jgi:hypothetical protein